MYYRISGCDIDIDIFRKMTRNSGFFIHGVCGTNNLLSVVNKARVQAGLDRVPTTVIRYQRRIVKPFDKGAEA